METLRLCSKPYHTKQLSVKPFINLFFVEGFLVLQYYWKIAFSCVFCSLGNTRVTCAERHMVSLCCPVCGDFEGRTRNNSPRQGAIYSRLLWGIILLAGFIISSGYLCTRNFCSGKLGTYECTSPTATRFLPEDVLFPSHRCCAEVITLLCLCFITVFGKADLSDWFWLWHKVFLKRVIFNKVFVGMCRTITITSLMAGKPSWKDAVAESKSGVFL